MYLSKNSRYVLQKAQLFSPSVLKGVERNLSVKTPKEDPTKPPLRLNIPESHKSIASISDQNEPSISPSLEQDFLPSSEKDIQFSKFTVSDITMESKSGPAPPPPEDMRLSTKEAVRAGIAGEQEYCEGLKTILQEYVIEEALGENYFKAAEMRDKREEAEQGQKLNSSQADIDPKTLYIIIDVPGKKEERGLSVDSSKKNQNSSLYQECSNSFREGLTPTLERKSRSLQKFSTYKHLTPRILRNNFQVHELADASTYIFQLKLGKANKGIVCVPERDIRTRYGEDKTDGRIKVRINGGAAHPPRKQVIIVEERPETVKYADDVKEEKDIKFAESKRSDSFGNPEEAEVDDPPLRMRVSKDDKVGFKEFVEDDFGSIRTGVKNYPFRVPTKRPEKNKPVVENTIQEKKPELEEDEEDKIVEGIKHHLYDHIVTHKRWEITPSDNTKGNPEINTPKADEKIPTIKKRPEGAEAVQEESSSSVESRGAPYNDHSLYVNISEIMPVKPEEDNFPQKPQSPKDIKKFKITKTDTSPEYCNLDELVSETRRKVKKHIPEKKLRPKPKTPNQANKFNKLSQQTELKKAVESDAADFHTSARCLTITTESIGPEFATFGSAFPPLLNEALKNRFRLRKQLFQSDKRKNEIGLTGRTQKVSMLDDSAILFPQNRSEDLDSDSLFLDKDAIISKLIKNDKETPSKKLESEEKPGGDVTNPVDSLTVMKKVKEIVQFDLNNVVKLFDDGERDSNKEQHSVVVSKSENSWEVDKEDLARHIEMRKSEMKGSPAIPPVENDKPNNTEDEYRLPLYFPAKKGKPEEMKLDGDHPVSVVLFDNKTNKFFIEKESLEKTVRERANLFDVSNVLRLKPDKGVKIAKSGDSILVFDVDTQTWKVDFSILEKRKQQQQLEEELTKRSEAILETFERLEKEQFASVSKPNTKEKKTFDYKKEEWKAYDPKNKTSKAKLPYKKSNPEEIRKKNSDMFENMFEGKKKTAKKSEESSDPSKQPKLCTAKTDPPGGKPPTGTGSPAQPTQPTQPSQPSQPSQPTKPDIKTPAAKASKDEDHFWETFLKIQVPPRAIKEPLEPKNPPTKPPEKPQPKEAPQPKPTTGKVPKIEEPDLETPKKRIEEPRFRIHLPFIKDRKIEKKKETTPPPKPDGRTPPPSSKIEKKDPPPSTPKTKVPPPLTPTGTKGDPPIGVPKKPPPTIGAPAKPPSIGFPPTSPNVKIQDPKPAGGKTDKAASASEHYVSDKIIEISRNKSSDHQSKIKTNKIETVKLNITSDTRIPSKITEINLNKKFEGKEKEQPPAEGGSSKAVIPSSQGSGKKLNKHLENFKTPFSDPDFEEKTMKIKPDLESNPNLRKLDNWNKTLVLHDIMKPPENLESWLKDETDKMATLLLKVLQEAGDTKSKKKHLAGKTKPKSSSQENARKKQKNLPENFFFRVQTMNLALGNDKKAKSEDKSDSLKEPGKTKKDSPALKEFKLPPTTTIVQFSTNLNNPKVSKDTSKDISRRLSLEITEDVPGPAILKRISAAWKMLPVLSSQLTIFSLFRFSQLVKFGASILGSVKPDRSRPFDKLFSKYGPVVNVQGPLSGNVILLHKPEHIHAVFEQDVPVRSVFDSLEQVRKDFEEKPNTAISNKWYRLEWNFLRRGTNDPIFQGLETYFGCCNTAVDSLVYVIRKNRNAQDLVSEDFMHEIRRWSLEGLCNVLFDKSFGYLEGKVLTDSWVTEPEKLYMAMEEATNCLNKCERGFQSWRVLKTPSLMGLSDSYRTISTIISKQLNEADVSLKSKGEQIRNGSFMGKTDLTFVESMLLNDGLLPNEIICNLTDIMLIGTNVMNSALGFLLYNLAQHPHAQKKLFSEVKKAMPGKNAQLSYNQLYSLKYLQACLKESLRLHTPIPVFHRQLQNDILVANYIIPKGTYVIMDWGWPSMKEQNFLDPEKFMPERWINDEKSFYSAHYFVSFPFCHGPKGDLIKRVVEMQLLTGIAKIIRNFAVEYHYEEIQGTETLISIPDKPLKLNFAERDS